MKTKTEICNAFNAHAVEYEQVAVAQREIGRRLLERLQYIKINPRYVLDLGCGSGEFTAQIKNQYPQAHVIGLDFAHEMLKCAQPRVGEGILINADMLSMPFEAGLFDLILANQVVHWAPDLKAVIGELNRVMNPGGCLMFSTLGPDTFQELKAAWASVDHYHHVHSFVDLHDVGDALLAAHFLDPVVDMETLTLHYASVSKLVRALKAQGVRNIHTARNPGLTGTKAWRVFEEEMARFQTPQGQIPLTYEVIYGHAWKGDVYQVDGYTETRVAITSLRRRGFPPR